MNLCPSCSVLQMAKKQKDDGQLDTLEQLRLYLLILELQEKYTGLFFA